MPDITDASLYPGRADEIFSPSSEAGLLEILSRASRQSIPVTFMGALTGLTGAAVPQSGWAVSLARLNHLQIENDCAIVGPGVLLRDLQSAAARSNRFYAPDPTENTSSLGGNIAANASGSRSYRFGATRDHVIALRVALINGEILDIRRGQPVDFPVPSIRIPHTTKFSAGYRLAPHMDLVDLFVGSEGTLGVITQAELKLLPAPGELLGGVVFFPSEQAALDAVDRWRSEPSLRMIEYLDRSSLQMLDVPHGAALMIEQEGGADLDLTGALENDSWFAISASDRERFRQFRHSLPERVNDRIRRSGFMKLSTDYAVPLDRSREMLAIYRKTLDLPNVIFGHIGDAHLHINTFCDSPGEFEHAKSLMNELAAAAVGLGGTVGAEHGLGKRKAHLLAIQYSPEEIAAMRDVKRRFDPQWLLGQGTLLCYDRT
ncbi:MAG TPA: FAD-binding oxidoreductase [Bryobacteraceae bacterium]|nr:FAD-binding oxidoreductase [Bryobacteraceae bacterium]